MHILHLEDSRTDAELIRMLLKSQWPDCRVTSITNGPEFEEAVVREEVDLILSDYTLPGYDGLAALAYARAKKPECPFIYISGTIGEERAIEALKAGATDYVIKDRPARLIPAIRAAIMHVQQEIARRRAEEKVREQASLLDKAHEAICVTDANRRITYWNASAERLYGWKAGEVMGRDLRMLLYAADIRRFDAAYALVLATREWQGQLRPQPHGADAITVESSWSLVTDDRGLARSILIIDNDITERMKLHAQLMTAQRLESIGLLAGGIAHDLNNVLAPILTSIDLLRISTLGEQDEAMLETLEQSAEHGADLVRQLLAFARGTGGQRVEVAVDSLIDSVRRLLDRAMPPSVEVRANLPDELWMLQADATQLRQVLLNLCLNARDAMAGGGVIELRAENRHVQPQLAQALRGEPKSLPYVVLHVSDTGTGIPGEIIPHVFDPFFTTKDEGKGTGLGLANVATIVEAHGGFVELDTEVGRGTTFRLYFPALIRREPNRLADVPSRVPLQGRGESVLVIEDDAAIRTVIEVLLHTRGYKVTAVSGGAEGLSLLQGNPGLFSLVMTDLSMPKVSGFQVIRAIDQIPGKPRIIAMSGLARDQLPESLPVDVELVPKPLTAEVLLGAVRRVLDARS